MKRFDSTRTSAVSLLTGLLLVCGGAAIGGAEAESRFLTGIRQLTMEGRRAGEGYFSPDGKALVFQSERDAENPFYQIFLLDLESGDTRRLSPGSGKTTCSFVRPGSDEVLFASTHADPEARQKQKEELDFRASGKEKRYSWDYDDTFDLYTVHRDGTGLRALTRERGYDAEGAYSPDGKLIVFSSNRHAYTENLSETDRKRLETDKSYFCEIYVMNADGSEVRRLTRTAGYDGGPFFSPDGSRVIWRRFDEHGVIADVYTMKVDGSDVRQLTDFGCMSWAPYYHPSGRYVVFTANKLGFANFELFIVDADGTREPVRVTHTDGFDGLPVFAPDGNRLAWTANRTSDQKSQIFLARWNHEAALQALAAAPARVAASKSGTTGAETATAPAHPAGSAAGTPKSSDQPAAVGPLTPASLRLTVEHLTSAELAGRGTGTDGTKRAAEFIVERLRAAGLQPLANDFRQPFEFTAGIKALPGQNTLAVTSEGAPALDFAAEKDFRPLSFTASGTVEGEVVFAGYGLTVPEGSGRGYNSYQGLDVSNRIMLLLRYVPEDIEPKRRQELNVYAGLRYKAMMARQRGAKAILVVTGPNSPNAGKLAPLSFDTSLSGSGIIGASITDEVASALLKSSGKDLKALQTGLDSENPHADGGFVLPKVKVRISAGVEQIRQQDHNVLAVLPPTQAGPQPEYIMVGAHYDHLGHGEGRSLERSGEEGQIHPGADDNGSGVATVLALATELAAQRTQHPESFRRGVIFALWSGEEIGLIGSAYFAEHPPVPLTNVAAYVNFDMVGRLRDDKLTLQGIGSSSIWKKLVEKRNVAAGFTVTLQDDPYVPTDVTSIYPKGVPVLHVFTGSHEDYHRPTDTAEKLNYEGMQRIATFARGIVLDLVAADRPDYLKVTKTESGGGGRETLRAYLGTIPDYTQEAQGVKLSGVRGGGPAEKAGLKGGDVIVEFAGQKISNIYEYTYAMDSVKIGQPVKITVLRNGQRVEVTVIPEARK